MNVSKAEVISIGDEIISGQRLDTNSQWISDQLEQLGIEVRFHSSVGDSLEDGMAVFLLAAQRADIVVSTGGIGPTKDDLTRQVIADVANTELHFHEEVVERIVQIFAAHGREMPENNKLQAWFPKGSIIIPNAEGTAPGIDITVAGSRIFSLPGVPYEMKQMWVDYLDPTLRESLESQRVIKHHVLHCFGAGESQIELLLQGLTDRGRKPRVGITASQATISLRVTASCASDSECENLIHPTIETIKRLLGNLVFGENGDELQDVVIERLRSENNSLSIVDFGFGGGAGNALSQVDREKRFFKGGRASPVDLLKQFSDISEAASAVKSEFDADIGVAVSPMRKDSDLDCRLYDVAIDSTQRKIATIRYGGHSGLREARTLKQILNQIRLFLLESE